MTDSPRESSSQTVNCLGLLSTDSTLYIELARFPTLPILLDVSLMNGHGLSKEPDSPSERLRSQRAPTTSGATHPSDKAELNFKITHVIVVVFLLWLL